MSAPSGPIPAIARPAGENCHRGRGEEDDGGEPGWPASLVAPRNASTLPMIGTKARKKPMTADGQAPHRVSWIHSLTKVDLQHAERDPDRRRSRSQRRRSRRLDRESGASLRARGCGRRCAARRRALRADWHSARCAAWRSSSSLTAPSSPASSTSASNASTCRHRWTACACGRRAAPTRRQPFDEAAHERLRRRGGRRDRLR